MTVALTIRCDGRREYLERTVKSIYDHTTEPFIAKFIIDDSGDLDYQAWLDATFPEFVCIHHDARQGLGACFQSALAMSVDADYGFFVEDDTPLLGYVDIAGMAIVLQSNPSLSQLMLMRPPFNTEEVAAGGVYQMTPGDFTECTDGLFTWVEHDKWYGFQPNLTPAHAISVMLSEASNFLELGVTDALKPAGYNFGYWGGLHDAPLCNHDGTVRSSGYRW